MAAVRQADRERAVEARGIEARRSLAHVIIIGEDIAGRFDFRQYINNAHRALECGNHSSFEEIDGNIDAAEVMRLGISQRDKFPL